MLLNLFGAAWYGKVDEVPGMFHVTTRFVYVFHIPLLPVGSHAVFTKEFKGGRRVLIALSAKSVFTAWLRGAMALAAILGMIGAIVYSDPVEGRGLEPDAQRNVVLSLVVIGVALTFFVATYHRRFRLASYARAMSLADKIGLSDADLTAVESVYTP